MAFTIVKVSWRRCTGEMIPAENGREAYVNETDLEKERRIRQRRRLAADIMDHIRDQLVARMPFFNRAILKMPVDLKESFDFGDRLLKGFGTDGAFVYAVPTFVLHYFRKNENELKRICLHMIFHCLFCHPFAYDDMNRKYWDFAADAAVEAVIIDMRIRELELEDDRTRERKLREIREKSGLLTAERIYHYMVNHPEEADEMLKSADLFRRDIHLFWLSDEGQSRRLNYPANPHPGVNKMSQEWKKLGVSVKVDTQIFEKNQGMAPGSLMENIGPVHQEKYDYSEFLKKFAVLQEEVHINQEEFDYIYYTYGMQLYGNIPLIEPLEYRENKKIRDFVIAIDTSGSCQGRTIRSFLDKTYSILKSTESYFQEVNIHIIQCDAKIQSHVKITNEEEFEEYMHNIQIHGFGGTDFRPVFRLVDEMVRKHELENLKGLIYFTDGMGIFPEKKPDYKTAFVFLSDGFRIPKVPAWAIRLVLQTEDLEEPVL